MWNLRNETKKEKRDNKKQTHKCTEQTGGYQRQEGEWTGKIVKRINSTLIVKSTEYYTELLNHYIVHLKLIYTVC